MASTPSSYLCHRCDPWSTEFQAVEFPGFCWQADSVCSFLRSLTIVNTHRPTFAAHFLVELSTGASLSEALQHGHTAGIARNMGVSSRTPTDLRAWAATAPRCFPQPPKASRRWYVGWADRSAELALAASFGGLVAWLAERCCQP